MTNSDETLLDSNLAVDPTKTVRRRSLLPGWIKVFIWIFMIFGGFALISLLLGIIGFNMELSFYGLESYHPLSSSGLFIISLGLFKGVAAFGLWTEKDWAIKIAIVDAVIGIAVCTYSIFMIRAVSNNLNFRLELILLIPYLIKLFKIRSQWDKLAKD